MAKTVTELLGKVPLYRLPGEPQEWLDVRHPDPAKIRLRDLARSLAEQPRWLGMIPRNYSYSVAQHSMLVASFFRQPPDCVYPYCVNPRYVLAALLHDASEAYLRDIPCYVKQLPGFDEYRKLERGIQRAVLCRFGVWDEKAGFPSLYANDIHYADKVLAAAEAYLFFGDAVWRECPKCQEVSLNHLVIEQVRRSALLCHDPASEFEKAVRSLLPDNLRGVV